MLILPFALCFSGCDKAGETNEKPQVYASFYAMSILTREIAGDRADVHTVVPPFGEPHDYEPTANDIKNLLSADVVVYNGGGMETMDFEGIVSQGDAAYTETAAGIPVTVSGADPHVWLDVDNAMYQMEKIKDALAEADEKNAEYYEENYRACEQKAAELKKSYADFRGSGKKVIVTHGAYAYLLNALGLEQVSIENNGEHSDPSPHRIAELVTLMAEDGIGYVFYDKYGSDKLALSLAKETGAEVLTLNSLESGNDGDSYFDLMAENIENLLSAVR